jgi:hypothetical protein
MKLATRMLFIALSAPFVCQSGAQAQDVITTCGQTASTKTAVLANNLNCSATGAAAINFLGKELDLQGHTVVGHPRSVFSPHVIECDNNCVISNGTLIGGNYGVYGAKKLSLENVTVESSEVGAVAIKGIQMTGGSISDCGNGISTRNAKLYGVTITGSDDEGVYAYKNAKIEASAITSNRDAGIYAGKAKLEGSTVTGNCVTPSYDVYCSDIQTCKSAPKLESTTCNTSNKRCFTFESPPIMTWGVCSMD